MGPVKEIIVQQDYVTASDLFNVNFDVVKKHLKLDQHNKSNNVTSEQIEEIFSKSIPQGFDTEICAILDQGYTIAAIDNGISVRELWISKKKDNDLKAMYVRSDEMYSAFSIAVDIFHKTLELNVPFKFDDWFGKDKYSVWACGSAGFATNLDYQMSNNGMGLLLDKTTDGLYQIKFDYLEKKSVEILCKNITAC